MNLYQNKRLNPRNPLIIRCNGSGRIGQQWAWELSLGCLVSKSAGIWGTPSAVVSGMCLWHPSMRRQGCSMPWAHGLQVLAACFFSELPRRAGIQIHTARWPISLFADLPWKKGEHSGARSLSWNTKPHGEVTCNALVLPIARKDNGREKDLYFPFSCRSSFCKFPPFSIYSIDLFQWNAPKPWNMTLKETNCLTWQWVQFSSVQSLSRVRLFVTPLIAARQASLSITNSRSSLRLTSIESVMPSSHLILCRPLLLLPPIPPGIRVFSNESTLRMRWPKYWSCSFSVSPSNEHPGLMTIG